MEKEGLIRFPEILSVEVVYLGPVLRNGYFGFYCVPILCLFILECT